MLKKNLKKMVGDLVRIAPALYSVNPFAPLDKPWRVADSDDLGQILYLDLVGTGFRYSLPYDNIREFLFCGEGVRGTLILKVQLRIEGDRILSTPFGIPNPGADQFFRPA